LYSKNSSQIMSKAAVLLIDVQNDFHSGGSLAVPGAEADAVRLAAMIEENLDKIGAIFVTLDSHNVEHIAHTNRWNTKPDGTGEQPGLFTLISHDDVVNKRWCPTDPSVQKYCEDYTRALEEKGRFKLTIWPNHCIMGTPGHDVVPCLQKAINIWLEKNPTQTVQYVRKGQNNMTEMYSAIEAEVPVASDPLTQTNFGFIGELKNASKVIIGGQALSHCVNYTTRDLLRYWTPRDPKDLILLLDGASPVAGCEADGKQFVDDMRAAHMTMKMTTDAFD